MPLRHFAGTELDHVDAEPHRGLGREDPFLLRDVLLEDVRLDRPAEAIVRDVLLVRDADVEPEEHRGGPVDGHGGGDLVERDAVEEELHVLQRVDGNAFATDLAERLRMIGVVAHERRHVEGGREPRLSVLEQVSETGVRLLGHAEAGELAHRPKAAAVHRRIDAPRVREDPGKAEIAVIVDLDVVRRVERLHVDPRHRREQGVPFWLFLVELAPPLGGCVCPSTVLGRRHGRIVRTPFDAPKQPFERHALALDQRSTHPLQTRAYAPRAISVTRRHPDRARPAHSIGGFLGRLYGFYTVFGSIPEPETPMAPISRAKERCEATYDQLPQTAANGKAPGSGRPPGLCLVDSVGKRGRPSRSHRGHVLRGASAHRIVRAGRQHPRVSRQRPRLSAGRDGLDGAKARARSPGSRGLGRVHGQPGRCLGLPLRRGHRKGGLDRLRERRQPADALRARDDHRPAGQDRALSHRPPPPGRSNLALAPGRCRPSAAARSERRRPVRRPPRSVCDQHPPGRDPRRVGPGHHPGRPPLVARP